MIKNDLKPAIEQALKDNANGRGAAWGDLNALEWQHLANNLLMISPYAYASQKAGGETGSRFGTVGSTSYSGGAGDGERGNAF